MRASGKAAIVGAAVVVWALGATITVWVGLRLVRFLSDEVPALSLGTRWVPRPECSWTDLPDGRVLLAGGIGGSNGTTTEILDVRTGRFEPAGRLLTSRCLHSAVLLNDGRVLLAGGLGGAKGEWPRTIEVHDPSTRRSRVIGELRHNGAHLPAICLKDGTVLLAGVASGDEFCARIDPEAGTIVYVGHPAAVPGADLSAVRLSDGKVLVTGSVCRRRLAAAYVFDPAKNRLVPQGAMLHSRFGHRSTLLADGRVLITGGHKVSECEIYDPATGAFTPAGSLSRPRTRHQAVLLMTGEVLVFGGFAEGEGARAPAESFDPKTRRWRPTESPRGFYLMGHALLLPTGEVLAANDLGQLERFDPKTGRWRSPRGSFF